MDLICIDNHTIRLIFWGIFYGDLIFTLIFTHWPPPLSLSLSFSPSPKARDVIFTDGTDIPDIGIFTDTDALAKSTKQLMDKYWWLNVTSEQTWLWMSTYHILSNVKQISLNESINWVILLKSLWLFFDHTQKGYIWKPDKQADRDSLRFSVSLP